MNTARQQPRPEHPKPQFCRENWINLNGPWTYEFDFGKSGMDEGRQLFKSNGFKDEIIVPFCPESKLSRVGYKDFIEAMWYHRVLEIPKEWSGRRIILHFGGVDYECEAFIDGISAGIHYGGTVSFSFDITRLVKAGSSHNLVVRVLDELRKSGQPRGKQCFSFKSQGCSYTRTTGIWQTVWLEAVDMHGLKACHIIPDYGGRCFTIIPSFYAVKRGLKFQVTSKDKGMLVAQKAVSAADGTAVVLEIPDTKPWEPKNPFLYDLVFEVIDSHGTPVDCVNSYAGLRKIHIEGNRLFLNNKPLYVRFVLDQGFYPDGIWTAPSDEALRQDILLAMKAGFNGARLHQKVFEERFHYWADKLGYLTWGESASCGCNVNRLEDARNFLNEWREIVMRDRNKPSIIAWTPFNETRDVSNPAQHHRLQFDAYDLTKSLDPTRPVNDASGYIHARTDLWTVHHYERPDRLADVLTPDNEDGVFHRWPEHEVKYESQPYINDEFGGIKWIPKNMVPYADDSFGYGEDLKTEEEFYSLIAAEVEIMLKIENLSGYCYTQLTDVEQEQNGIYNYDRTEKFDMERITKIFQKEPQGY